MSTENEMTVPEMDLITAKEIIDNDLNGLETLLYVIRGLGIDRDRSMTFAEFAKFIQTLLTKFSTFNGASGVTVDADGLSGYTGGVTYSLSGRMLEISSSTFELVVKNNEFTYGYIYNNKDYTISMTKDSIRYTVDEEVVFEIKPEELKMNLDDGGSKFIVDKYGISFERDGYRTEMTSKGFVVYFGERVIFEVHDGNVVANNFKARTLKYDSEIVPGIIIWDSGDDEASLLHWREDQYWTEGQIKRFALSPSSSITSINVTGFEGSSYSFNVSKNRFYELICIGFYEDASGKNMAKLIVNG